MKKSTLRAIAYPAAVVLVFCSGVIGYLQLYPHEYLDALYFTIRLYLLNYDIDQTTPLLELARWGAPSVILTTVFWGVKQLRARIALAVRVLFGHPVALYGDTASGAFLAQSINVAITKRCCITPDKIVRADTYVIMHDTDAENVQFFTQHVAQIVEKNKPCWYDRTVRPIKVYIKLEQFDVHLLRQEGVEICPFSLSDFTAQNYWQSQSESLYDACCTQQVPVHLAILGDGITAQKILHYGLLCNLFSPTQSIHYHMFGDWNQYDALHLQWQASTAPNDVLTFHTHDWQSRSAELLTMQAVIVCGESDAEQLQTLHWLRAYLPLQHLHIKSFENESLNTTILHEPNITVFGQYATICTEEVVLRESLIAQAKAQHMRYQSDYPESNLPDWDMLDQFTRGSNLSSVYFQQTNLPLLQAKLSATHPQQEIAKRLAELEHMRWMRYHALHNWAYAPQKDRVRRTHPDLIPFAQLSLYAQEKDYAAMNLLMQ